MHPRQLPAHLHRLITAFHLCCACLIIAACSLPFRQPAPPDPTEQARLLAAATATVAMTNADQEAERLLGQMSLEQKVGQVMVVAFREDVVSPAVSEMIRERHVGGVVLFKPNLHAPPQIRALTQALQELARTNGAHIPLFTMLDQEGGIVVRATDGVTTWPSQMLLGATGDEALAQRAARMNGEELRSIGINMNLAPVLDVNSNPDNPVIGTRSFGADPKLVARMGAAAIRGYQEAGVVAVGKHFPGHGDTSVDSHIALPVVDKSPAELDQLELIPFQAAVKAGVDCIMTAHIAVPRITGGAPGTLSENMLETMLRTHLSYDGLIITDDLEMGAIVEQYGTADAAVRAFRAGADLLLFGYSTDQQRRGYDLLLDAVQREPILKQRLDQSVRRILRVKLLRGIIAQAATPALDEVDSPAYAATAQETAAAGLTLVRNDAKLLPLDPSAPGELLVLAPRLEDLAHVEIPIDNPITLGDALAKHRTVSSPTYPLDPDPSTQAALVAASRHAAAIVIGTYNTRLYDGQRALVEALLATGKPVVVVSLRLPYDLLALPNAPTFLAAYDDRPATLAAVADALFGIRAPTGHLPVPLGDAYPLGYGLREYVQTETVEMGK